MGIVAIFLIMGKAGFISSTVVGYERYNMGSFFSTVGSF